MMYTAPVKRLQILIEEELDEALESQAVLEGPSKAGLIRRFARARQGPSASRLGPLGQMVGADDFAPKPIDDVVYRRSSLTPRSGLRFAIGVIGSTGRPPSCFGSTPTQRS